MLVLLIISFDCVAKSMEFGLISCTKSKRSHPCRASEMYSVSPLFRKAYSYALNRYDLIGILSAKYGFLAPDYTIEPYDLTLKNMNRSKRLEWSSRVFQQMNEELDLERINAVFFHAGKEYREFLIPKIEAMGIRCYVPLKGLSFGRQLAWYNQYSAHSSVLKKKQ